MKSLTFVMVCVIKFLFFLFYVFMLKEIDISSYELWLIKVFFIGWLLVLSILFL